jgi:hypothetical protein
MEVRGDVLPYVVDVCRGVFFQSCRRLARGEEMMRRGAHLLCAQVVGYLWGDGDGPFCEGDALWRGPEEGEVVVHDDEVKGDWRLDKVGLHEIQFKSNQSGDASSA